MNSVRSNNLSLKYQRFKSSDCKDVRIRKFEFVTKNQILWKNSNETNVKFDILYRGAPKLNSNVTNVKFDILYRGAPKLNSNVTNVKFDILYRGAPKLNSNVTNVKFDILYRGAPKLNSNETNVKFDILYRGAPKLNSNVTNVKFDILYRGAPKLLDGKGRTKNSTFKLQPHGSTPSDRSPFFWIFYIMWKNSFLIGLFT